MITFGPMPPHAVSRPSKSRPILAAIAVSSLALALSASSAAAQTALSHTDDATPLPGGSLRVTITNGWTRYDSRFDENGVARGLGDELSTDSLGPRQLPKLAPVEAALQTLTNNPAQRLTLGKLDTRSDAR